MSNLFDDDRYICFNAAKNDKLEWYNDRMVDVSEIGFDGLLYGIADYGTTNSLAKMILQMPYTLNNLDKKLYVSFNKATGINSETAEGINKVLIHIKNADGYADS